MNWGPKERRVNREPRENQEKKARRVNLDLLDLPDPPGLLDPLAPQDQVHRRRSRSLRHHPQKHHLSHR